MEEQAYIIKLPNCVTWVSLYVYRVPLLFSTAILYTQVLVTKLFFIGDTNNKHTELTNRYQDCTYLSPWIPQKSFWVYY